jgi:hypothetical protein
VNVWVCVSKALVINYIVFKVASTEGDIEKGLVLVWNLDKTLDDSDQTLAPRHKAKPVHI